MAKDPKIVTPIDAMVQKAFRGFDTPDTVTVANDLVFKVSPDRTARLNSAQKDAERRLFDDDVLKPDDVAKE